MDFDIEPQSCEVTDRSEGKATIECDFDVGDDVRFLKYSKVYETCGDILTDLEVDGDLEPEINSGQKSAKFKITPIFTPGDSEDQSDIVSVDSENDVNRVAGCVRIEAWYSNTNDKDDGPLNIHWFEFRGEVNDNTSWNEFTVVASGPDAKDSGSIDSASFDDTAKVITAEQCDEDDDDPTLGDEVCIKIMLKDNAIGELTGVKNCNFKKGGGSKWKSMDHPWTEEKCNSDKTECTITTMLPSQFYANQDKISCVGDATVEVPTRRFGLRRELNPRISSEEFELVLEFVAADESFFIDDSSSPSLGLMAAAILLSGLFFLF